MTAARREYLTNIVEVFDAGGLSSAKLVWRLAASLLLFSAHDT
jgi:hypothetical protein